MDAFLTPRFIPLIIVIGAPIAGLVITQLIRAFKPTVPAKPTWVIASYVLMLIQAIGMYFALS